MKNPLGFLAPQRGRAPVPSQLPGQFFVLEYDREAGAFRLHVDDADHSTYDLPDDSASLQTLFRALTTSAGVPLQPTQIDRTIDIARELGMAQYIPTPGELVEDRVLSIIPRGPSQQGLQFDEDEDQESWLASLRPLGSRR